MIQWLYWVFSKQMYEELRKEVDWERQHPDGEALHVAAFDDSGNFCVAYIWESEEHLNNFINNSASSDEEN